jgi:hypothetical protein
MSHTPRRLWPIASFFLFTGAFADSAFSGLDHLVSDDHTSANALYGAATTSAATPTPAPGVNPNVLVSMANSVREFTPTGALVRKIPFNYNNGPYQEAECLRDMVVGPDGSIDTFNGTFSPFFTRYSPSSKTFTHTNFSGWSTINALSYGGIAAYQSFVYVTDMATYGTWLDSASGIVRFDQATNSAARFLDGIEFIDLTMGLDGYLYALTETYIYVYHPVTMGRVRRIFLPAVLPAGADIRGIAVDQTGRIFLAELYTGTVFRMNSSGTIEMSGSTGSNNLLDIDIDETGRLILGQRFGQVILGDSTLNSFTSFNAFSGSESGSATFVAFAHSVPIATPPPPPPAAPLNVSTRGRVEGGQNVMIGGFIVGGDFDSRKMMVIRALGPSLTQYGVNPALPDPVLELHNSSGGLLMSNDNWKSAQLLVEATGLAPHNDLESAIVASFPPGNYTAIVKSNDGSPGIGLIEIYDLTSGISPLVNLSTRGLVQNGDNVLIGGFILGPGTNAKIIVRAIGPSLAQYGVTDVLQDPVLELHNGNGALIYQNDDWQSDQQQEINDTGLAPHDPHESAIVQTLQPGNYTAIVRGKNNTTGVALVEVYNLETN